MRTSITVPDVFRELFQPSKQWRHYCYYGGRSSGKSTQVAQAVLLSGMRQRERGLCTREVQNSIAESVHQLLSDLIAKNNYTSWEVQRELIRNKKTGSEIYFKGLHNNSQSIKSFEGVDWCWVEEAQSVSSESINTLIPTIRKPNSRFYWTFNPLTDHDPVWELVAGKPDERTFVKKVNSDAIEELLSPEIIAEREKMRIDNPDLFGHVWLGNPLTSQTGSVFGNQLARAEQDGRIGSVPYDASAGVYAVFDLGIGDSTAVWWFQCIGREIHMIDYYENSGEELGHYIAMLKNKGYNYTTIYLPHDAKQRELQTGKTRVEFFEQNGFHNIEVLRPTNFNLGDDDINLIARPTFSRVWIDRNKCERGLECLRAYHYEYDAKNKLLKNRPEHDWSSHASSAFIYACMAATESAEAQQVKVKFKTYTPKAFRQDDDNDWF